MTKTRTLPLLTFVMGMVAGCALGGAALAGQAGGAERPVAVTGIGGVFFKADDPEALRGWYREHLGIEAAGPSGASFLWLHPDEPTRVGRTVWSLFPRETEYFGPAEQEFMVNYRVSDLDALLAELESKGVRRVGDLEEYDFGRFAWILDGEGNRVELWEPRGE